MVLDCSKIAFEIKFSRKLDRFSTENRVLQSKIVRCGLRDTKSQRFLISYFVSVTYKGL